MALLYSAREQYLTLITKYCFPPNFVTCTKERRIGRKLWGLSKTTSISPVSWGDSKGKISGVGKQIMHRVLIIIINIRQCFLCAIHTLPQETSYQLQVQELSRWSNLTSFWNSWHGPMLHCMSYYPLALTPFYRIFFWRLNYFKHLRN